MQCITFLHWENDWDTSNQSTLKKMDKYLVESSVVDPFLLFSSTLTKINMSQSMRSRVGRTDEMMMMCLLFEVVWYTNTTYTIFFSFSPRMNLLTPIVTGQLPAVGLNCSHIEMRYWGNRELTTDSRYNLESKYWKKSIFY